MFTNTTKIAIAAVAIALMASIAAAAPPGVRLEVIIDQTGNNAGIAGIAIIHNDNSTARTVSYRRTVHNAYGTSQVLRADVPARGNQRIGSTCAFDVSYSSLCGSPVTYEVLD